MKILTRPAKTFWQRNLQCVLAATLATAFAAWTAQAADARQQDNNGWHQDHRMTGNENRDNMRREWNQRRWHGDRKGYSYRPQYRGAYTYAEPVYLPPPVYYQPRRSPGISLFFPLDLR